MPVPALPTPPEERQSPRDLLAFLEAHVGEAVAARLCAEVLAAATPDEYPETVRFLGGSSGDAVLAGSPSWQPYWTRVWAARGLLYVWDESAAPAVLEGLRDVHWRVAEMCLKVAARRELPAGDEAARLASHSLPRVRAAALRALAAGGDVEHVDVVREAVHDDDEEVRRTAARALERMAARLDLA